MFQFDDRPFIAIWETTRACDLQCLHCRACAMPSAHPDELTNSEAKALLRQLAAASVPLVVLTGGDPAKRDDLVELVGFGKQLGLEMGLTPSATPLVTYDLLRRLKEAGLGRLAISVDGSDAELHDAFRGVAGSFDTSLRILRDAASLGIPTQINTTVRAGVGDLLEPTSRLVEELGCVLWSVFFVVPTGRANTSLLLDPEDVERRLNQLADISKRVPFAIKTTAAPHYRRVLAQRKSAGDVGVRPARYVRGRSALTVNEGRGMLFVSHTGEVYPSGFLPVPCGNVRDVDPIEVYREHPMFVALRDADSLSGKCGACEYRVKCGGSRARAYAMSRDYLASDESCAYVPSGYDPRSAKRHLVCLD
ncbi:MAG: TIGR04053 family radical SAM/SPASM domain-containing protein [Polyangiaceae bacterium]